MAYENILMSHLETGLLIPSSTTHYPTNLWFERTGTQKCKRKSMTCWLSATPLTSNRASCALSRDLLNMLSARLTPGLCSDLKRKINWRLIMGGIHLKCGHQRPGFTEQCLLFSLPMTPAFIPRPLNSHCCWPCLVKKGEKRHIKCCGWAPGISIQWKKLGLVREMGWVSLDCEVAGISGPLVFLLFYYLLINPAAQELSVGRMRG